MPTLRERLFGRKRDPRDPHVFHKVSLIAFFAWVGLGADGLSSSAYGPEEAFKALGEHSYLAVFLAVAVAFTVFIISYGYSRIIEHFPQGGGGYVVASKYLGRHAGLVAGSALLVDYVLTIAISLAAGGDAIFSFLPHSWHPAKLEFVLVILGMLTVMNLRGAKESVVVLTPIFLLFVVTHVILIVGSIALHAGNAGHVASEVQRQLSSDVSTLGLGAVALIFMRAFALGGGTFTGIEAVSNGLSMMREPRVKTGKHTMILMASSLAFTAAGILIAYLLMDVAGAAMLDHNKGKTMNAILVDLFAGNWEIGGLAVGRGFVILALVSEGALLFVAAQAGFLDGPRVMSNMALDQWLPSRFSQLSEQLTMRNGVYLMAGAAAAALVYTRGSVHTLVVMYSINVFVTFSLSNLAMMRHWLQVRRKEPWKKHFFIHGLALFVCVSILAITVFEKFTKGGWITLVLTSGVVVLCMWVRQHYKLVARKLGELDQQLSTDTIPATETAPATLDPRVSTAVVLAGGYGGLGLHTLLQIPRVFPGHFKQVVFVSVGVIDAGNFKGTAEVQALESKIKHDLERYVEFARTRMGWAAESSSFVGTEAVSELERLCREVQQRYSRAVFFSGKLIFRQERWWQRALHNETANAVQRRLQFAGLPMLVLPIRVTR